KANPFIKSPLLSVEAFRHHLYLDSHSEHYRPVQNLSMMVDYFFWSDNPYGFHLSNVLLHAASGVLLFFLLRCLFNALALPRLKTTTLDAAAFLTALVWVVHPVHSAAIDYISGRADSLAFFFATAGWLLFFHASKARRMTVRVGSYLLAATAGLCALCSRETGLLWLVIFSVFHLGFGRRTGEKPSRLPLVVACLSVFAADGLVRRLAAS